MILNPVRGINTIFKNSTILELAEKYNRSAGQILLKFQVERGISVIPKSENQKRQSENFDLFSFSLSELDMRPVFEFFVKVV